MEKLTPNVVECYYKQNDRCIKEQFINRIKYDIMMSEIIKESVAMKNTSDIKSDTVLTLLKGVEDEKSQSSC